MALRFQKLVEIASIVIFEIRCLPPAVLKRWLPIMVAVLVTPAWLGAVNFRVQANPDVGLSVPN